MRVAFATCAAMPGGSPDDAEAAALIGAEFPRWDDASVDWHAYDRVVPRSVWDYSSRLEEFLGWCRAVGPARLRNDPELVAFNADKRYLGELDAPCVPTVYLDSGDPLPPFTGEVVIKPNVSAGARDTGRFTESTSADAAELVARIHARGGTALVQPYLPHVDDHGETAVVFIGGRQSHVLRKRAVLRGPGVAPVAPGELQVAAAMFEDDLVVPGTADAAQLSLAEAIHDEVSSRFGTPLYARVDMVATPDGRPVLLELEVIEPRLYLLDVPGSSERFAAAIRAS